MTLKQRNEQLGINLYQATQPQDYMIAMWWDDITASGEIEKLVASNARTLSSFFRLFQPPNLMSYTEKDERIESAHWLEPVATSSSAVFLSSWWEPESRGTKRHAQVMSTVYETIFAMGKKTILGVTKQGELIGLHRSIGYDIMGPIPNLFDDEPAWIMSLTELKFKAGRLFRAANKSAQHIGALNAAA